MLKKILALFLIAASLVAEVSFVFGELNRAAYAAAADQSNQKGQNYFPYSQKWNTVPWQNVGATVTENFGVAPDGTVTSNYVHLGAGVNYIYNGSVFSTIPSGAPYTESAWLRATTGTAVVRFWGDGSGSVSSGDITLTTAWKRYSFTVGSHNPAGGSGGIITDAATDAANFEGWGFQLEIGRKAKAYNRTLSTGVNTSFLPAGAAQSSLKGQNLISQSEALDGAAWTPINTSITANNITAPDGTLSAELITATGAGGLNHYVDNIVTVVTTSRVMVDCAYVKAGTARYIAVGSSQHTAYYRTWFDTQTNTIASNDIGVSGSARPIGNTGWYRVCATFTVPIGTANPTKEDILISPTPTNGTIAYVQAGETAYAWGAQVAYGNRIPAYNKTQSLNVPFNTSFFPAGAKQSSQLGQNELTFSQDFTNGIWTKVGLNAMTTGVTDPFGGKLAQTMNEDGSIGSTHRMQQPEPAGVSGKVVTYSVFLKSNGRQWAGVFGKGGGAGGYFDVTNGVIGTTSNLLGQSVKNYGNGWFRCSITYVSDATQVVVYGSQGNGGPVVYTGSNSSSYNVYGAQLVLGTKAGAYNKTTVSTLNPNYNP